MLVQPLGPVLILGAGCELGRTLARKLITDGVCVLCVCSTNAGLEACQQDGLDCLPLADTESLPLRFTQRMSKPVASLVDCMHTRFESLVSQASPQDISTWAVHDITKRALVLRTISRDMLTRRQGRCIFVSSVAAGFPAPGQAYYAAAKLAGEALYRSLGAELGSRGITTCSLRLSWLDVGRGKKFLQGKEDEVRKRMPTGQLVSLEQALTTLCFLLSPAAFSFNAQTLILDGGLSAVKPHL